MLLLKITFLLLSMTIYNMFTSIYTIFISFVWCSTCLPSYLPTYLRAQGPLLRPRAHHYLPACLPAYLPTCLPACLPTCLPANLPTYRPTGSKNVSWVILKRFGTIFESSIYDNFESIKMELSNFWRAIRCPPVVPHRLLDKFWKFFSYIFLFRSVCRPMLLLLADCCYCF